MAETPSELQTEIEKLEARHAEHPEGRFFVPLANAYRKAGSIERAEAVLREGLRRHPDYLSAHIVLGRCLADRGAVGEATAEFEHVLAIDPQNLIALRTLGDLAMSSGQPAESARWYRQLLAVDPMNEDARRALEALPDAEDVPPLLPESEEELYGGFLDLSEEPGDGADSPGLEAGGEVVTETIAELYARQGLHDRAAEVYRELIRRRGGDAGLERRLAELTASADAPALETTTPPTAAAAPEPPLPAEPERAPEPEPYDEPLPVLGDLGALPEAVQDDETFIDADPVASSFEHGFLDLDLDLEAGPEPGPDPEPEPEPLVEWAEPPLPEPAPEPEPVAARAAISIAAYLSDLASWRPGATAPALESPATPFAAPDAALAQPAPAEEIAAPEPIADLGEPVPMSELEPAEAGLVEPEPIEPEPIEPEPIEPDFVDEPERVADLDMEVAEPWVSRASVADATEPAPEGAAPALPQEDMLFPWEMGDDAGTATMPEPPAQPAPPAEPPAASPPPAAPPAVAQEEDDDLESFQAWLRSLKR